MEAIFVLLVITIPCLVALAWCFTPWGKKWRRANDLL